MAGIEGIEEFKEFHESMRQITGASRSDGIEKARRDALRETADDFIDLVVEQIKATKTTKGGTLDSRTSPYEPGGENESTKSSVHISDKKAWDHTLVGNDIAAIFPKPEAHKRASWLEYGTSGHGPKGDKPMYFEVGGATIIVADEPDGSFEDLYNEHVASAQDNNNPKAMQDALFRYGEPGEVEGVEPQRFFRRAIMIADQLEIFKENMGNEIEKLFEEEGIILEGDW